MMILGKTVIMIMIVMKMVTMIMVKMSKPLWEKV